MEGLEHLDGTLLLKYIHLGSFDHLLINFVIFF